MFHVPVYNIRQTSNHRLMFPVVSPVFLPLFLTNILSLKTRRLITDQRIPLKIEYKNMRIVQYY